MEGHLNISIYLGWVAKNTLAQCTNHTNQYESMGGWGTQVTFSHPPVPCHAAFATHLDLRPATEATEGRPVWRPVAPQVVDLPLRGQQAVEEHGDPGAGGGT